MDEPKRSGRVRLFDEPEPARVVLGSKNNRQSVTSGELSGIEREFCFRWTSHYDKQGRGRAAMEAGYNPSQAYLTTRRLLEDPRIQRQIAVIESDRLRRLRFDGDEFMAREMMLATASMTELVELWIPPCRYCWGRNNEYQRTHAEFQEGFDAWMRLPDKRRPRQPTVGDFGYGVVLIYDEGGGKIPFDQRGGDGYDPSLPPNPACPNCRGRGAEHPEQGTRPYVKFKDTRELSDAGKILYAGVELGPRGIKQLTNNQDAARTRLMNMLGKFVELRALGQVRSAEGQPALGFQMGLARSVADLLTDDPRSLSDGQLNSLLMSHGVVIDDDGESGQGAGGAADSGEAPPPGRVA